MNAVEKTLSEELERQPRLTYPDALQAVKDTIDRANPGQVIIVDRWHVDRDGRYFTVTVTTREQMEKRHRSAWLEEES